MASIPAEILIPLVERRRVLWDKTLANYKDKGVRLAAWREICRILNPNFDELNEKGRKEFCKGVSTKWIHIRDAFMRAHKKFTEGRKSGITGKSTRPYIFKDQLQFLVNEPRTLDDSSNDAQNSNLGLSEPESIPQALRSAPIQLPPLTKKPTTQTLNDKMTQFLEFQLREQENPHISFIKGVLPSLELLDDDETLEFQAGVLELIKKIKRKRQDHLYGPYGPFTSYQNQHRSAYFSSENSTAESCPPVVAVTTTIESIKSSPGSPEASNGTAVSHSSQESLDL